MSTTLVLGGTGKTGRRVAERLSARGVPVQVGSRSGAPPFDWADQDTWTPVLRDVTSVYVAYAPDLAWPGGFDAVSAFVERAVDQSVRQLVLCQSRPRSMRPRRSRMASPRSTSRT